MMKITRVVRLLALPIASLLAAIAVLVATGNHPVVRGLTSLPVTSAVSHLHYDHTGNYNRFETSAMIDLPALRERANGNDLILRNVEHLGFVEDFDTPTLSVREWWRPGEEVDPGGRRIMGYHTPGHTRESITLHDPDRDPLVTGDTYYPGELFAFPPGSFVGDCTPTTESVLAQVSERPILYGADRMAPLKLPTLGRSDLVDLLMALNNVRAGIEAAPTEEGFFPQSIVINKRMSMLMDIPAGRRWD